LAEVAIQSGRHAAAEIWRRLDGERKPRPFRYRDLGSLAAVSRYYAIGERRRARVWGFAGWLAWLVVHLTFLTGFKNRVSARFHWTISFFGRSRPERTITAQQIFARQALTAYVRNGSRGHVRETCSHEIHLRREGGEGKRPGNPRLNPPG
jgi:NADH:quinone reductase (non-electrogenic)